MTHLAFLAGRARIIDDRTNHARTSALFNCECHGHLEDSFGRTLYCLRPPGQALEKVVFLKILCLSFQVLVKLGAALTYCRPELEDLIDKDKRDKD